MIIFHDGPTSVNNLPDGDCDGDANGDGDWDCRRPPSRLVIARRSIELVAGNRLGLRTDVARALGGGGTEIEQNASCDYHYTWIGIPALQYTSDLVILADTASSSRNHPG